MRYALLMHHTEMTDADVDAEMMAQGRAAFDEYGKALVAAGVLVSADVLQPSTATVRVSVRDKMPTVLNGPLESSAEPLTGIIVIDVDDLTAARHWAEKCPAAAWGTVEIRPVATSLVDGEWTT